MNKQEFQEKFKDVDNQVKDNMLIAAEKISDVKYKSFKNFAIDTIENLIEETRTKCSKAMSARDSAAADYCLEVSEYCENSQEAKQLWGIYCAQEQIVRDNVDTMKTLESLLNTIVRYWDDLEDEANNGQ